MSTLESTPNWLIKRKNLTPDRPAVIFQKQTITFQQLYEQALEMAGKLHHQGIKKGDKVAILLKNHLDTIIILHSLQMLGCPAVLLNIRLQDSELLYQMEDSEAIHVITQDDFYHTAEKFRKLQNLTVIYKEFFKEIPSLPIEVQTEYSLEDVCTVMYTSGTTGYPKGVIQSYGNHWWSSIGSLINLGLHEQDAWLVSVPLFHISGYSVIVRSVIYGIPILLFEKFDEVAINHALKEGQATIISVVSSMVQRMLESLEEEKYSDVFRCMLIGGGPVPLYLLEACKAKNIPVFQTYGLTETSSQIVTLSPEDSLRKLGSAGKPLFPSQVKIMIDGTDAGPNEIGEIVVKGPNVTNGYYKREKANRESFTEDGWFLTGDMGYIDEDGFLFVVDRRSDLIISGGENIYPAELENIIQSHPAIREAAVVGISDPDWGQVPCAFYVLKQGMIVSEEELTSFCSLSLAKYKIPKKWYKIEELPKNASNKIVRRQLKEQAENWAK